MAYTVPQAFSQRAGLSMLIPWFCLLSACGGGGGDGDEAVAQARAEPALATSASTVRAAPSPTAARLEMDDADWAELVRPFDSPHEAVPAGVPAGYDWRERSRLHAGNQVPSGFAAFTGWAQAFWAAGAAVGTQRLELRQMQSLLCRVTPAGAVWQSVQKGGIEGASFRADFAGDSNVPADTSMPDPATLSVSFGAERAFHFWPRQGRIALAGTPLCGVLVTFQARAVAPDGRPLPSGTKPALLVGGGADFWKDTTVAWDQFRTNAPVGSGQLRLVQSRWRWYGMATGDAAAMEQLRREGYLERSNP